ncbi:RNA polymerase sigma factor SigJ [Paenibacillus macerans]|uniref:RNA polymerase sigma factor SigJ n=1 Tax=Paenibacillus macerans TaxID=44252 RepID=UPI003D30F7D1
MHEELYKQYRRLLFHLAYQLTGSVSDAEDVVQDVFLKTFETPLSNIAEPKAYLCKMVTNRCKDLHKSARKQREEYYGEWLPEPLADAYDEAMETETSVVRNELLSYAMLVLLERLTITERTVFVLREALGFDYGEIAGIVGKTETNCRKLFSRASAKLKPASEEEAAPAGDGSQWAHGFMAALKEGNMEQILSLLDKEVVLVADGGGKVRAIPRPIGTRELVARFLLGPVRQAAKVDGEVVLAWRQINGQPAIVMRTEEGVHTVGLVHAEGNVIRSIYIIRNPDKLKHVGA